MLLECPYSSSICTLRTRLFYQEKKIYSLDIHTYVGFFRIQSYFKRNKDAYIIIQELLLNPGIVRNKLKVRAAVTNAQAYLKIIEEKGSFSEYLWEFVGGKPIVNSFKDMSEVPATSPESDLLSKDLKKKGFKFVGSTIVYAFMQAVGMVNDHTTDCFKYPS